MTGERPGRLTSVAGSTFSRYVLVGLVANGAGYLLYLALTALGTDPKLAMSLLYFAGAAIGFIGNRQWTFAHRGHLASGMARYAFAHGAGYLLNFMLLVIFADALGLPHQLVQAAAIGIVAVFLFTAFRYFVFSADTRTAPK